MKSLKITLGMLAFTVLASSVGGKHEMSPIIATAAAQNTSNCYQIQNMDRRNLCLAQASGQSSYCYQIQNMDLRNSCLAVVTGQRSYCYQIQDMDSRNSCLAML